MILQLNHFLINLIVRINLYVINSPADSDSKTSIVFPVKVTIKLPLTIFEPIFAVIRNLVQLMCVDKKIYQKFFPTNLKSEIYFLFSSPYFLELSVDQKNGSRLVLTQPVWHLRAAGHTQTNNLSFLADYPETTRPCHTIVWFDLNNIQF